MISTINVSLPKKLKDDALKLVKSGYYASFSDLVRESLRKTLQESELDRLWEETKKEIKQGKGVVLNNKKDIDNYFKTL